MRLIFIFVVDVIVISIVKTLLYQGSFLYFKSSLLLLLV